jgi:hypothetical protein
MMPQMKTFGTDVQSSYDVPTPIGSTNDCMLASQESMLSSTLGDWSFAVRAE